MKVCHTLICCFFLSLQDGNTVLVNAQNVFSGTKGEDVPVQCSFPFSGTTKIFSRLTGNHEDKPIKMRTGEDVTVQCDFTSFGASKFFCKDSCQEKVLVGTDRFRAQRDRYSIRYITGTRGGSFVFVTITNLTKSDSGQYWCGLDRTLQRDFELIVTDDVILYVGVTLGLLVILLAVAALVFCRKRTSKEPLVEAEYASVTEADRVYEGVREGDRQSSSPVEMSSVHTGATYTKSDGAKTSDDSFDAGATSQHKAEDDSGALTYAQVKFSSRAAGSATRTPRVLNVSITQLTKSDSGRYICGLDRRFFVDSHEEFEISVTDALTSLKPSWSPRLFSTSVPSDSTPTTTTQSLSSRSGSSTPSSPFPGTTSQSKQQQTEPTTTATTSSAHSGKLLYVGVMLLIKIVVLSLAVLTFCRRKARKLQKLPAETEHTYPTEAGRMYEDIREDRPSRPPPVEISSVYTCVKYTKPDKAEVSDDYSFVTDPNCTTAASSQHKAEDDSDELTYSKVVFPNSTAALLKGTPTGNTSEVLCSVPQVGGSSDPRCAEHDSAPLYSTVTLPQQ
ncbi:uncharacterized protein AKAME5_002323000 [Lates japonicus]|uniref:Immunoglobulin domain-containing protein n=1 Tax=Lates japonicus TaxID=270547 RepID=A0AAD3NFB4_LATJO|nr:uncharacterized protein AKAME5_002323000 [Lates japonicus]